MNLKLISPQTRKKGVRIFIFMSKFRKSAQTASEGTGDNLGARVVRLLSRDVNCLDLAQP
jgi:hypothetical protein